MRWESAGKDGSETGFLQEMILNQYALFTKRSKTRKGNPDIHKRKTKGELAQGKRPAENGLFLLRKALRNGALIPQAGSFQTRKCGEKMLLALPTWHSGSIFKKNLSEKLVYPHT